MGEGVHLFGEGSADFEELLLLNLEGLFLVLEVLLVLERVPVVFYFVVELVVLLLEIEHPGLQLRMILNTQL